MITRNVTLWFGSAPRVTIPVSQYDDMWQFVFSIVNDSVPWSIPDTAQVTLNGVKPDGNVFAYYGTVSGGKATVDCDIQMTAVAGLVECELSILDSSKVVGTANFFLAVEQAPKADDAVVSESTLAAYGEVLDQISQYAAGFIPEAVKTTLLNCFAHVAWVDEHGQDYYDALATALAQKEVVSISAVFTQGAAVIYDTDSLESLKQYLVVTATFDDTSTEDVTSTAELSGSLTVGTSTITVTYSGKTTTFDVTVSIGLDSIAYGTYTYRDIFITNNLVGWFGDFESNFVVSSSYTYSDDTTPHQSGYRISQSSTGTPTVDTTHYNSPTHSVGFAATGSNVYMNAYATPTQWTTTYIVAFSCNISSYTSGKMELQLLGDSSAVIRAIRSSATDGWQSVIEIGTPVRGTSGSLTINFGALGNTTYGNANLTGCMDDIVVTPLPEGMTQAQALELYNNYLKIRRGEIVTEG